MDTSGAQSDLDSGSTATADVGGGFQDSTAGGPTLPSGQQQFQRRIESVEIDVEQLSEQLEYLSQNQERLDSDIDYLYNTVSAQLEALQETNTDRAVEREIYETIHAPLTLASGIATLALSLGLFVQQSVFGVVTLVLSGFLLRTFKRISDKYDIDVWKVI